MKQLNKVALALAATLVAGSVMAEGPQLYAVLGAGQAESQDFCSDADDAVDSANTDLVPLGFRLSASCDDTDTSWKIAGGAQFNDYLAVEFQYHDLGESTSKISVAEDFPGGALLGTVKAGRESRSFGIHVLPQLPITEELSAFFRLGFVRAGVEATGDVDGSDYETTTSYGFGVQYDITSNIAIRGEYDFINNVGEEDDIGEDDITYLGVSAVYKF